MYVTTIKKKTLKKNILQLLLKTKIIELDNIPHRHVCYQIVLSLPKILKMSLSLQETRTEKQIKHMCGGGGDISKK